MPQRRKAKELLAGLTEWAVKPIAGRWGSIVAIQDRVAKAGFAKVAAILQRVCRSAPAAAAGGVKIQKDLLANTVTGQSSVTSRPSRENTLVVFSAPAW